MTLFAADPVPPPARMLEVIQAQARNLIDAEGTFTGEVACWQANWQAERFLEAYRATGDPEYIAAGIKYFDALLAKLHTSPDGFRGWVGPYVYDKEYSTDVPIADAILTVHMLDLAKLILVEEPENLGEFASAARRFVEFARRDVIEKWQARGTWNEDGPYGFWVTWPMMFRGQDLSERVETQIMHDRLGYQFNKQTEMALVALRLWEITGEESMRDMAARVARLLKSRLTLWDDHYTWNYSEPVYAGDIWSVDEGAFSHGVFTHPHRHYQVKELKFITAAHRAGIVFDQTDMKRFAATHDTVMWNGDFENPDWPRNSDAAVVEAATGAYNPSKPANPGQADMMKGQPWSMLAPWSDNIRRLAGLDETPVPEVRMTESFNPPIPVISNLKMAAVIPASVSVGETSAAITSVRAGGGPITIELLDAEGNLLREITTAQPPGTGNLIAEISSENLAPGTYAIRFSRDGQSRDVLWFVEKKDTQSKTD